MARLSEERLVEIRSSYRDLAADCVYNCPVSDAYRDLLADRDELTAEVERLREAAVVGEAIERGLAMEDGDRGQQGLSLTRQQEGRESTYRVFGYRITGRGYLDTVPARKTVEARTLAAALRAAGLMGKGEEVAP